jgi:nicotinate-nucleotide adenylyltransferase
MSPGPIGILGGTFDPVHHGHLRSAIEVREQLGLSEVRLVPAARPPHRDAPSASAAHRLAMLELALAGSHGLRADDREIRREGPSWMVDTLASFRAEAPGRPLFLIIGQDAANGLDGWHRWRELFGFAHLAIMRRPDARADYGTELATEVTRREARHAADLLGRPAGGCITLPVTALDISATAIRRLVAAGRSPAFLTPDPVVAYMRREGLYSGPEST